MIGMSDVDNVFRFYWKVYPWRQREQRTRDHRLTIMNTISKVKVCGSAVMVALPSFSLFIQQVPLKMDIKHICKAMTKKKIYIYFFQLVLLVPLYCSSNFRSLLLYSSCVLHMSKSFQSLM